jgi:dihydroorotate dehydrogenase
LRKGDLGVNLAIQEPTWHSLVPFHLLGVNLGKNKSSDAENNEDYVKGVRHFADVADYLVINVSSPNTPGLRLLQNKENLISLLKSVMEERERIGSTVPICVKLAPDMSNDEFKSIANIALQMKVDGLIVSNTTIQRPALKSGMSLSSSVAEIEPTDL